MLKQKKCLKDLPGPFKLPFFGSIINVNSEKMQIKLDSWAEKYGPIYHLKQGKKSIVVISSAKLINQILLERPDNFRRMKSIETVCAETNIPSLLSSKGDKWRKPRKIMMQTFAQKYQARFFPEMNQILARLVRYWSKNLDTNIDIDVKKDFLHLSLNVITSFVAGYDLRVFDDNKSSIEADQIHSYLQDILEMLARRTHAFLPYWHYLKLPIDYKFDRALREMNQILYRFIDNAQVRMKDNPSLIDVPNNFLEAIIAKKKEKGFIDKEIIGNSLLMLLAGEDAVAFAMVWLVYYMCMYPEVQNKIQKEVDDLLGEKSCIENFEDIKKLVYLEAAVKETLRLHPADHSLFMETNRDVELGNVLLPKNVVLFLLIRSNMQNEQYFEVAGKFHPERWLKKCPFSQHDSSAYIPFGKGARACPGFTLTHFEMKLTIAMVCRNFALSFSGKPPEIKEKWGFIMAPESFSIKLRKR